MNNHILSHLPYKSSFRFVDNISLLNEDEVMGEYTLRNDAFFYEDHFVGNPVTPGVIITEIMAQIGLVVLGMFLVLKEPRLNFMENDSLFPLLTSTDVSFYKIVLPGQKVTVISKKQYFRFGKLKCYVELLDSSKELVAKGMFSGVIKKINIKND
ncbi:3-hydroxyacyl-ACP dehydratase FabZ family protein [Mucilaginibacter gotjawali]|uniref:3-hydroxyacyl-[acyl-carrier-protein] dehydratase n=2 Tax=Mucilaginibacter gotjawali TaxID=1550579 RepID=A0A839S9L5_9SPHI|nr:hydroxymyristoyl-ACP dehydratase [Mucilaginibacter gotjawali]MBB3054052.1 3-hydroxyacyl-[acyl-carrier-protein] dehydratase [Mucilaginibacter gotjawali]BAU54321.1 (3R)-hydroxymyristoyl-ACP dehydratase [Mucilaginibacter gotjawali]